MKKLNRREFLLTGTAAAAGLAGCRGLVGQSVEKPTPPPNILIIHTDQQSSWTLGAYGGKLITTPHIDSLARDGAMFTNHFVNAAVCTPSRGTLLTGRYPHAHGAHKNDKPLNRDEITLAHRLSASGYITGYAGKWHLDGTPKPGWLEPKRSMGFQDCRFMFNRGHWKKITDRPGKKPQVHPPKQIGDGKTYTTDWLTDKTIDFINESRKRPFFYMLSIPDPHTPFTVRPPYNKLCDPKKMTVPSTFFEENKPRWAQKKKKKKVNRKYATNRLRRLKAQYLGEVKCIDDNVGRIIASLKATKQLDNTIVIFTTDHGEYMGEHGLWHKNNIYETAYRVPLIIRWPKKIRPGTVVKECLGNVDFHPTLLGLLGLPCGEKVQGRDASPLLQKKKTAWTEEAFLYHPTHNKTGIFTPEYQLALVKDNDHVLFDRRQDPAQTKNLFHDPAHIPVIKKLLKRLVDHHTKVKSPELPWIKAISAKFHKPL